MRWHQQGPRHTPQFYVAIVIDCHSQPHTVRSAYGVQSRAAASAQTASHSPLQHTGSRVHTSAQQSVLSQPGDPLPAVRKQSPAPGPHVLRQNIASSSAQVLSHSVKQQNGSVAQTVLQQSISLQPGVPFPVVPSVQAPAPRAHAGKAPVQIPAASSTQTLSQFVSQQNGSIAHTDSQQLTSLQPPEPFAAVQSPDVGVQVLSPQLMATAPVPKLVPGKLPTRTRYCWPACASNVAIDCTSHRSSLQESSVASATGQSQP